jgi:hypothetical protein
VKTNAKGLGDTVKKLTDKTGITTIVKALFGDDCGCDERQERLNKLFPYSNYITEEEFKYIHEFISVPHTYVTQHEKHRLTTIFNRVFNQRRRITSCSKCYVGIIEKLTKLHDEYLNDIS